MVRYDENNTVKHNTLIGKLGEAAVWDEVAIIIFPMEENNPSAYLHYVIMHPGKSCMPYFLFLHSYGINIFRSSICLRNLHTT